MRVEPNFERSPWLCRLPCWASCWGRGDGVGRGCGLLPRVDDDRRGARGRLTPILQPRLDPRRSERTLRPHRYSSRLETTGKGTSVPVLARAGCREAAYAEMAGVANTWTQSDAGVAGHPMPVMTLSADPNLSLVFMRLPDGNVDGSGFAAQNFESLQKLYTGAVSQMTTVDGSSSYTLGIAHLDPVFARHVVRARHDLDAGLRGVLRRRRSQRPSHGRIPCPRGQPRLDHDHAHTDRIHGLHQRRTASQRHRQ